MKIYFCGSIGGGRQKVDDYHEMIEQLSNYGDVLTKHVGDKNISSSGENLPPEKVYERDIAWLDSADVVVAELSVLSLGVGYEVGYSFAKNKKMLCLYDERLKAPTAMIRGNCNILVHPYKTVAEAKKYIKQFFEK